MSDISPLQIDAAEIIGYYRNAEVPEGAANILIRHLLNSVPLKNENSFGNRESPNAALADFLIDLPGKIRKIIVEPDNDYKSSSIGNLAFDQINEDAIRRFERFTNTAAIFVQANEIKESPLSLSEIGKQANASVQKNYRPKRESRNK